MLTSARTLLIFIFALLIRQSECKFVLLPIATGLPNTSNGSETVSINHTFCAIFNPKYISLSSQSQARADSFHHVVYPNDSSEGRLGCTFPAVPNPSLQDAAVLVDRGNCHFYRKALVAQEQGAALLVVAFNTSVFKFLPHLNPHDRNQVDPSITIPVVYLQQGDAQQLKMWLSNSSEVYLRAYEPPEPTVKFAPVVLFLTAMSTVLAAAFLANTQHECLRYGLLFRPDTEHMDNEKGKTYSKSENSSVFGITQGLQMILYSSTILLLQYFFYSIMVYVLMAFFSVLAVLGLYHHLSTVTAAIPFGNKDKYSLRLPPNKLPILKYRPNIVFFLTLAVCVGVVMFWVVQRHSSYAWIIQNLLGSAFISMLLYYLVFTERWVLVPIMVIIFFYDIFMVFVTPFFTRDGVSVMEAAVTGKDSGSMEKVPLVFLSPPLHYPPVAGGLCSEMRTTDMMLGFGDVYIPGWFITICLRYDHVYYPGKWFRPYYITSSIAYAVGLILTYVALVQMQMAQPALLYLVPTMLGSVALVALIRQNFCPFFFGRRFIGGFRLLKHFRSYFVNTSTTNTSKSPRKRKRRRRRKV